MTEILALIPARGGSKGIPRKNIRNFAGYPLVVWSIAAGLQAKSVSRVMVSTDDEEIAAVARDLNATAIVTTEKDAVRLDAAATAQAVAWAVLPMQVIIEPAEPFASWLGTRLHSHTVQSERYERL